MYLYYIWEFSVAGTEMGPASYPTTTALDGEYLNHGISERKKSEAGGPSGPWR